MSLTSSPFCSLWWGAFREDWAVERAGKWREPDYAGTSLVQPGPGESSLISILIRHPCLQNSLPPPHHPRTRLPALCLWQRLHCSKQARIACGITCWRSASFSRGGRLAWPLGCCPRSCTAACMSAATSTRDAKQWERQDNFT